MYSQAGSGALRRLDGIWVPYGYQTCARERSSASIWTARLRSSPTYQVDRSAKAFLPEGNLLVASMTQKLFLKFGAEKPAIHADLTDVASGYLRDLAVARDGNAT